jgi:succinate dehydrogenase/fumarate reductase iron-sulfur protein
MKINVVLKNGKTESRHVVECEPFRTVLDALELIRTNQKPDLIYRHSCHHGSCGTCGATVNGKPRLMCLTKLGDFVDEEIVVEPLKKMMKLEGIAVWPGSFFKDFPDTGYLRNAREVDAFSSQNTPVEAFSEFPDTENPVRLENCIECGLCVAACPVQRGFVGPAALAAADIELKKNPDRRAEMLELAARPDGVRGCERYFECSKACPQGIAPGRRIAELLKLLG